MRANDLAEFKGIKIVSIVPYYEKHYYTSGADINKGTFGGPSVSLRTSSYKNKAWSITLANNGRTITNVELQFSLVDASGVTHTKTSLWYNALDPDEKMRQKIEPGSSGQLILKRMIVGREAVELNHAMPSPVSTNPSAWIIFILGLAFLCLMLRPHYKTHSHLSYPQIDVVKESSLYLTPDGKKTQSVKPGSFLRLIDKTSGPESTRNGVKIKWYKVATGTTNPPRWIRSDAVNVTDKHKPAVWTTKDLEWGW